MMQFQANVLGEKVIRPRITETTALGAAYLAGLATGYWKSIDEIKEQWKVDRVFTPDLSIDMQPAKRKWANAIHRAQSWIK